MTGQFRDISEAALAEKDHTSHQFAQWFVNEQAEPLLDQFE